MNAACLECFRLFQDSNNALASYTKLLERIYGVGTDCDTTLLVLLEPDVQQAKRLLEGKTQAFEDHHVTHETHTNVMTIHA